MGAVALNRAQGLGSITFNDKIINIFMLALWKLIIKKTSGCTSSPVRPVHLYSVPVPVPVLR